MTFSTTMQTRAIQRNTYRLRKELVELRRIVLPMREVINTIMRRRAEQGETFELDSWYSDLYDHVIRAAEWTESLRDMVTTVSRPTSAAGCPPNTIMKKLTGWAVHHRRTDRCHGLVRPERPYPGFQTTAAC